MPRLRLLFLGLGLCLCALHAPLPHRQAHAQIRFQDVERNQNGVGNSFGLNLADRDLQRRLQVAENLIEREDHAGALRNIQSILDLQQDGFFRPGDEVAGRFISLKKYAESFLRDASPELLKVYELGYGAQARRELDEAIRQRNPKLAEEVMRRFVYSAAGADALYWLGNFRMDRGDRDAALQCFLRLKQLTHGERFEPQLSVRAALCLHQSGRHERAQELIADMVRTLKGPVSFGGAELKPDAGEQQITEWFVALSPSQTAVQEPTGWFQARGNAARNALFRSSPPIGRSLWQTNLTEWTNVTALSPEEQEVNLTGNVRALEAINADRSLAPLPAGIPLLVNNVVVVRYMDHLAGFDVMTGEELWRSAEPDRLFQLLRKMAQQNVPLINNFSRRQRNPREQFSVMLRQRTWEDLTFGTLSSDGDYVFNIEDLGFINDVLVPQGMVGASPSPLQMRDYNRLCAYEARTGKLKWELGGIRGETPRPLAGAYFLGPPLAVDHQLYCIVESQGLLELVALDSRKGDVLWSQVLLQPQDNLLRETRRRRAGLTPALLGDILVCPTSAGMIVTVDVASRSLQWAYQYGTGNPNESASERMVRMQLLARGLPQGESDPLRGAEVNEWQDGNPILAEGHVILTPRDSSELHCLSLDDGRPAWKIARRDGQYVAAVQNGLVIVVSSRSVEALNLKDGKPAWSSPVALANQAGRGLVTDGQILLPLISDEVVTLDLKSGRILSRSRIYDKALLGNLTPGQGLIVSQSATQLGVIRTLDSIEVEVAKRLEANPDDAEALAHRGEFRLSQGKIAEGQADLRRSWQLEKDEDTQVVLFESLLQSLKSDFANARSTLPEMESLAGTSSQRAALYRAWIEGLMAAAELPSVYPILVKLSQADPDHDGLERIDGKLSMRRDRWVSTQFQILLQGVNQTTVESIQADLRQRLDKALTDKDEAALRHLLQHFGAHPLMTAARLALAEQLIAVEYSIEAEQLLAQLIEQADANVGGRALALMIQQLLQLDKGADCTLLLSRLEQQFGDIVCLDSKTGRQLAEEWRQALPVRTPYTVDWPQGRVETSREVGPPRNLIWTFDVAIDGDPGPFFQGSQFMTAQEGMRLHGLNGWGDVQWAIPLTEMGAINSINTLRAQIRNHLVLVMAGRQVSAISTLTPKGGVRAKLLWNSSLTEGTGGDDSQFFNVMANRPGMLRPVFNRFDMRQNPVGTIGAIQDDSVVVLRGRHLILVDLLTGEHLWKRTEIAPGSEIYGDQDTIIVVSPDQPEAMLIRRTDGVVLEPEAFIPPAYARVQMLNQQVLWQDRESDATQLSLKLFDVVTQKIVWRKSFEEQAQYSTVSPTELAVLEPKAGRLTLLRLTTGEVIWQQPFEAALNFKELAVIPDGQRLLILHGEIPARGLRRAAMVIGQGNQVVVNCQADCVDRGTGERYWSQPIEGMGPDYMQPLYYPFWFFSVRTAVVQPPNPPKTEFHLQAIDKRTGKVIMKASESIHINNYQIKLDPEARIARVTLFPPAQTIIHNMKFTEEPHVAPEKVPAPDPDTAPDGVPAPEDTE